LVIPVDAWAAVGAYLEIEDQIVDIGNQLTVEVTIEGVEDLHAFSFDLPFNPNILQAVSAEYGGLLSKNGADAVKCEKIVINNADGKISGITCSRTTPDGISGVGALVKIIFNTVKAGKGVLNLENVKLTNSAAELIEFTLYEGEITIYPQNGKITGVVTDAFGPVYGADVVALRDEAPVGFPGRTDSDGKYIIDNIYEAGIYDVRITHYNYLPTTISNVDVRIGMTTSDVNVTLLPPTKFYTKVDQEGFIRDWLLLGPIPWDDNATRLRENQLKAAENKPGGTTEDIHKVLTPREGDRGSGLAKALRWTLHNSGDRYINLESFYREKGKRFENAVAYAFTSVKVPSTQTVSLLVGSDEGIAIWLNHELVHSNDVTRGADRDQDVIHSLTLKEGWNSILIKCVNRVGGWGFLARFAAQKPFAEPEFLTTLEVAVESQELQFALAEFSFMMHLSQGLHNIALPLKPQNSFTARAFAEKLGATLVIEYDEVKREFFAFLPKIATTDGFQIKGGFGYIVNLVASTDATFTGTAWSAAAPSSSYQPSALWAFAVGGIVREEPTPCPLPRGEDKQIPLSNDLTVTVKNLQTDETITDSVGSTGVGRFTVAFVDLAKRDVVKVGDEIEIAVYDASGNIVAGPIRRPVGLDDLKNASLIVNLRMGDIIPKESQLGQNYPNPFNPETWIPYQLASDADVTIRIYDIGGKLIRTIDLGQKAAGIYHQKERAAYWNGRNDKEEQVASGVYFYMMEAYQKESRQAGDFRAMKRMVVLK
jgi:hypothetical protein